MVELLPPTREGVRRAAEIIAEGGVVIYPTDTVYGIGCGVFNEKAVERVFEIKQREAKPMPVLCSSLEDVSKVGYVDERLYRLALALWPGAVSIVVEKTPELPSRVTAGLGKVAVRIPAHLVPLEIIRQAQTPIVGTSANISNQPPAVRHGEVNKALLEKADALVTGGEAYSGTASTVIEAAEGDRVYVVREGALRRPELDKRLRTAGFTIA